MAVALKTGKIKTIGMIVPLIDRNYFVQAIAGVETEIYKAGYNLIIATSGNLFEREKKIIASLSQGKVVGIILPLLLKRLIILIMYRWSKVEFLWLCSIVRWLFQIQVVLCKMIIMGPMRLRSIL